MAEDMARATLGRFFKPCDADTPEVRNFHAQVLAAAVAAQAKNQETDLAKHALQRLNGDCEHALAREELGTSSAHQVTTAPTYSILKHQVPLVGLK